MSCSMKGPSWVFLALLARVPAIRPRSDRITLREAIADADLQERASIVEAKGSGASPGAIAKAIEAAKAALGLAPRVKGRRRALSIARRIAEALGWLVVVLALLAWLSG